MLVEVGILCMLLVVVVVSVVSASYEDGKPDSSSEFHGDGIFWANSGEVTAWYCQPMQYCTEYHSAYSWGSWPVWVVDCTIEFTGKYYAQIMYHESWYNNDALSKSKQYQEACKVAETRIETRYINGITGARWRDTIYVGVIAGSQPG